MTRERIVIELLTYTLLLVCMMSCSDDEPTFKEVRISNVAVLRERPSENPWIPYMGQPRNLQTRSGRGTLAVSDFLGYSLNPERTPIENTLNLGFPVVDKKRLSKNHGSYFTYWKNASHETKVFSYKNISDYASKTDFNEKVRHGIDIKLFGIHLDHKHTLSKIFHDSIVNNSRIVFSELNIIANDSCYRMQYTDVIRKQILKDYIDSEFLTNIHTLHPFELLQMYGSLVIADFCSGGRATAYFAGDYKESAKAELRESQMGKEIDGSFSWKTDAIGNVSLSIGRGKDNEQDKKVSITGDFYYMKFSAITFGGDAFGFTFPQEVMNAKLNLTPWLVSLSNEKNNVIANFNKDGLIPIAEFIMEENVSNRVDFYSRISRKITVSHEEPKIYIAKGGLNPDTYTIYLYDRFGYPQSLDKKIIKDKNDEWDVRAFATDIAKIFDLKIEEGDYIIVQSMDDNNDTFDISSNTGNDNRNRDYHNLVYHQYKKFENKGILYLIDEMDKVGFSILNNSKLINEYGLKNYISTLPASTVSYSELIDEGYHITCL